jgi:hypothetical protein
VTPKAEPEGFYDEIRTAPMMVILTAMQTDSRRDCSDGDPDGAMMVNPDGDKDGDTGRLTTA